MKLNLSLQVLPINKKYLLKNPAHGGIFCLKTVIFFCLFLACSVRGTAQAKIEITDAKKNFGFIKRGSLVKIVYEVINTGNQPALIVDAEVSCSCTSVDFLKQPLLPGQKQNITVNFDTKPVYGRQDRVVLLHSNDPKSPAKLRYKGVVSKD